MSRKLRSDSRVGAALLNGLLTLVLLAANDILAGCSGRAIPSERAAREDLSLVASRYRPGDAKASLPNLTSESELGDYLRYAVFNNPKIEAAYFDWAASVERITTARSLPDPRVTFEADIESMISSTMPGLMTELPGPGKLRASGNVAAAGSNVRYFAFEEQLLRTAFAVKSAYYRLQLLEERVILQRETLALLGDLEELARQQNSAGRASLQDALRAQIEQDLLMTQLSNLEDARRTLVADLKAALGLGAGAADPPAPARFANSDGTPDREEILRIALERNPTIRRMAAEVQMAEASLDLARKAGIPDFSLGIEANFTSSPTMWTPTAGATLPIWRDKIAAEIAGAQAEKRAAEARLNEEQVQLATEFASMFFMYRESARNSKLLEERLVPRGKQLLQAARAAYASGTSGFLEVIAGYRQLLEFEMAQIEARNQRELALASLSLLISGVPPEGSPLRSNWEPSQAGDPGERSE
ncbi:MAG: TolC family protein [Planctomycetes bacterium]|nr:TolC family protein [Planctomycetota bacterium]